MSIGFDVGPHDISFYQRCFKWVLQMMGPRVQFLAPRQNMGRSDEQTISWWDIQVRVARGWALWRDHLPDAEIELRLSDFHQRQEEGTYHMRWRLTDSPNGREMLTLRLGKTYRIPIARRAESGEHPGAQLTNKAWFEGKPDSKTLPQGRYLIKVAVKVSGRFYIHDNFYYFLNVPENSKSNGMFYMDVRYDDDVPHRKWSSAWHAGNI